MCRRAVPARSWLARRNPGGGCRLSALDKGVSDDPRATHAALAFAVPSAAIALTRDYAPSGCSLSKRRIGEYLGERSEFVSKVPFCVFPSTATLFNPNPHPHPDSNTPFRPQLSPSPSPRPHPDSSAAGALRVHLHLRLRWHDFRWGHPLIPLSLPVAGGGAEDRSHHVRVRQALLRAGACLTKK